MLVPNYCKDVGHKRPTDQGQFTENIRVTTLPKDRTCRTWNVTKWMVRDLDLMVTESKMTEYFTGRQEQVPQSKMGRYIGRYRP